MMPDTRTNPHILLYTLTGALGDYLIMSDVMAKAERVLPNVRCLGIHRANSHTGLRAFNGPEQRFFNIYSLPQQARLIHVLRKERRQGAVIMGIQMAAGSLQGFAYYSFLKKVGALDFIVDFNLVNADIVTPPEGDYILHRHLNQLGKIFQMRFPPEDFRLDLSWIPRTPASPSSGGRRSIGLHPWARRAAQPAFVWPSERWIELVGRLGEECDCDFLLLGKDRHFDLFREALLKALPKSMADRIVSRPSADVSEFVSAIEGVDVLVSVNTAAIHVGAALNKKMAIVTGPSPDFWIPRAENIIAVRDQAATLSGREDGHLDPRFPTVQRISVDQVVTAVRVLLLK